MSPRWDGGVAAALAAQRVRDAETWVGLMTLHVAGGEECGAEWTPASEWVPEYVRLRLGTRVSIKVNPAQAADLMVALSREIERASLAQEQTA